MSSPLFQKHYVDQCIFFFLILVFLGTSVNYKHRKPQDATMIHTSVAELVREASVGYLFHFLTLKNCTVSGQM